MILQGTVGPQRQADGATINMRAGASGEGMVSELMPPYFEHMSRGNVFLYHVASQALILSATTGGHPTVFNPAGSGVLFVPLALRLGFISGTTVIGSVLIADTVSAGSQAATGAPIVTATLVAAKNALRGSGKASQVYWSPTTNSFTAAPTVTYAPGLNLGAAAPTGTGTYDHEFKGMLGYMPGSAMSVVYSVTTSTALFQITIVGLEIPLPNYAA